MNKVDRLKELEKIAEKLGIGQNKIVDCISCKLKIEFKDAIILTKKDEVKYLCEKCNKKLEQGELQLAKQDPSIDDFIKILDKNKDINTQPVPWKPIVPDWEPQYPGIRTGIEIGTGTGTDRLTYTVSKSNINAMYKFEPNYADRRNSASK